MERLLPWMLLLALSVTAFADVEDVGDDSTQESHVLVLDSSNFTETIKQHPFIVVEFYAPWCGHCKRLAPEYEKAAAILQTHEPPIPLAMVNADDEINKPLAREYGVQGYPSLKIIRNQGDDVQDYKGPRDPAERIASYLKSQAGPSSEEITSLEHGTKSVDENEFMIVGIFTSLDSEEFINFKAVADKLRADYTFAHTLDSTYLPAKGDTPTAPGIRIFKKFDEGFADLKEFSVEKVSEFIEGESMPVVVTLNQEPTNRPYLMKFFSAPESKVLLFANLTTDAGEEYKNTFFELAKSYKGKGLRFLIGDAEASENALQYFGLKGDKLPTIFIQDKDDKKYVLEKAEAGRLASWLKDYFDGSLEEFIKSEPIPEKNDEPVKIVVADSLQDLVINSGKNVLLEFYAPWCGHCKKLAPILEEVALFFESDPDVVIAKLDATANDITSDLFEVKGYPTLYFHSASGKVIAYDGERSKEDLIEFIKKNKDLAGKAEAPSGLDENDDSKDEL